ncbi:2OG-Fe(II) oxygenase [Aerolutibacter daejeonensis]|uniref:2OG-Fe(II) oxygenase n=1 Tax=Aerolutibacter daejeonensis TaxID=346181 RepID=UPI00068AE0D8|nr:2OG-Fe(II) oxygenase [Lysobacter daejeonensis]
MQRADVPFSPLVPTRELLVDGLCLKVFDGHLESVSAHFEALSKAAFTRTEVARPETVGYKHWVTEVRLDALVRQPIYELSHRAAQSFAQPGETFRPYRAYTNVASYGDMLFTHTDCLPGMGDLTALWYICDEWDIEWGGETVFYDQQGELAAAVRPRPGRLAVFDGAILHAGRPPNRICYKPRYTFAIKFERVAQ